MRAGFNPKRATLRDLGDAPGQTVTDRFTAMDLALTKAVATTIEAHYPGHPWRVEVSHRQGIIKIQLAALMGPTNWYAIHIASMKSVEEGRRKVIKFCGEILERFNMPRRSFSLDDFLAARAAVPIERRFHGIVPG